MNRLAGWSFKSFVTSGLAAFALAVAAPAHAGYLDLTTALASGSFDSDATFIQGRFGSGTGVFPAFVQLQKDRDDVIEGYNTTVNDVLNNTSPDTHNRELLLSSVGEVTVDGVVYYRFFLDINESSGGNPNEPPNEFLSLDKLQVYTSDTPNQSTTTISSLGTLEYDMGAGNGILLDYSLATGSGTSDMTFLVKKSLFPAEGPNVYVYLYSMFGVLGSISDPANPFGAPVGNYGTSDGFEEWAVGPSILCTENCGEEELVTPEPASIALMGTGLTAIALRLRRRRAAKRAEKV